MNEVKFIVEKREGLPVGKDIRVCGNQATGTDFTVDIQDKQIIVCGATFSLPTKPTFFLSADHKKAPIRANTKSLMSFELSVNSMIALTRANMALHTVGFSSIGNALARKEHDNPIFLLARWQLLQAECDMLKNLKNCQWVYRILVGPYLVGPYTIAADENGDRELFPELFEPAFGAVSFYNMIVFGKTKK